MRRMVSVTAVAFSFGLLVAISLPVQAQSGTRVPTRTEGSGRRSPEPGFGSGQRAHAVPRALEGYCPVSLQAMNKWVKGKPAIQEVFDGHTYHFANEDGKRMFSADPAKYAPVLGGDCVVSLVKMGKRVPGNIRYASIHEGRLFLFANEQGKQMFTADPKSFANADLAFGGNCPVCRVDMQHSMAGRPEFTVVHNGLRYLFPTVAMRDTFLANPTKYQATASAGESPRGGSGSRQPVGSGSSTR